jgi:hypothetical protein
MTIILDCDVVGVGGLVCGNAVLSERVGVGEGCL